MRSAREGKPLHVKREPKFTHDADGLGLTQILEIFTLQWKRDVGLKLDEIEETDVAASTARDALPRLRHLPRGRDLAGTGLGRDIAARGNIGVRFRCEAWQEPERYELEVPDQGRDV